MYSWRKIKLEWIAGILILIFIVLLFLKFQPTEGASGFYIIRPTYWKATPTGIEIELTSFYPSNLNCSARLLDKNLMVSFPPRGTATIFLKGNFTPNTYQHINISLDCGVIKEEGDLTAFIYTT
jgi:hypothetical protein